MLLILETFWLVTITIINLIQIESFYSIIRKYCNKSNLKSKLPTSWSSGNALGFEEGDEFKSRIGQIGHSVANGWPSLRHFFEERSCVASVQYRGNGPR